MISWLQRQLRREPAPPPEVRYILRPRDGIQTGVLPKDDPAHSEVKFIKTKDEQGDLYVAVCSFCGGNCGQCGTSIGQGVPFNFDLMAENGGWNKPGWGFHRRT